ncbi:PadR family transcriptional regulator [Streptoalloteichus hindustanus]|nr:PadR family transcriptional regulator [Streptoalloteichus hindustanus]
MEALADLRRSVLDYCVLILLREQERYGYELVSLLTQHGMVTSEGTIYPLLARLRRQGLIDSTWRESVAGPPRRYHRLTDDGIAAAIRFLADWRTFRAALDAFIDTPGSPS